MHVSVLLFPGAEELDVFGPFETLKIAADCGAALTVDLVAVSAPGPVRLAHGALVVAEAAYSAADVLVVPGGGWNRGAAAGARAESRNPATLALLRSVAGGGGLVAGVCTGAMILAAAGLLEGRPAVTHHSAVADLRAAGVDVRADARVVDAGSVVTSGGITAGLDLALHLVARFFGPVLAERTAAQLEYAPRGRVVDSSPGGCTSPSR